MRLLHHLEELDAACDGGVCMTIGVFDALHRGHKILIRRARDSARARGLLSLVFTFERHPLALIAPAYCPPMLTQPEQKVRLIEELGVDCCLMLRFTPDVAKIPAPDFIETILGGRCRARQIFCGWNFSFGAGGKGNVDLLKKASKRLGFSIEVSDPVTEGASAISSTRVRNYLIEGRLAEAEILLERRYGFSAEVVSGDGRGRQIGFPTANLKPSSDQLIPADGVYAVLVSADGLSRGGMMNIGKRPTFEGAGRAIEVHLFDFDGVLNGRELSIEFVHRVRDERKFDSVDDLVEQLKNDELTSRPLCEKSAQP